MRTLYPTPIARARDRLTRALTALDTGNLERADYLAKKTRQSIKRALSAKTAVCTAIGFSCANFEPT